MPYKDLDKRREVQNRTHRKHRARYAARKAANLKAWKEKNAEHVREYSRAYDRDRAARDLGFKLRKRLSSGLGHALKGRRKAARTVELLGCTIDYAITHIERQFQRGMSWENWGKVWHIDHIRPLCAFDLTDQDQARQACHFTNLRPLEKGENMSKGGKQVLLI